MNVFASIPAIARGLRLFLSLLLLGLVGFVVVQEALDFDSSAGVAIVLAIVFVATYIVGGIVLRPEDNARSRPIYLWLVILTIEALALVWLSPHATYIVFPLFFLYLYLIPPWWDVAAVFSCTLATILIHAIVDRLTVGGIIGPTLGASFAVAIAVGYRALYRESQARQDLIDELVATRAELAEKEREAGVLSERARLARDIHDTVAQGLSSIQLLLHAVERADAHHPGNEHVRLARETAALNLQETRRIIEALTPSDLETRPLADALERLAQSTRQAQVHPDTAGATMNGELRVDFHISGEPVSLPMSVEAALLRIAQGALANVVQHSDASHATLTLTYTERSVGLDVVDNGRGFDPRAMAKEAQEGLGRSFGFTAMRERVSQLGGEITIESTPGSGTAVAVAFGLS